MVENLGYSAKRELQNKLKKEGGDPELIDELNEARKNDRERVKEQQEKSAEIRSRPPQTIGGGQ